MNLLTHPCGKPSKQKCKIPSLTKYVIECSGNVYVFRGKHFINNSKGRTIRNFNQCNNITIAFTLASNILVHSFN